ncbi:sensor histidine kinase [Streptomyces sp. NPDC056930]|uniref:sensor histidine kinase n=1 Tax=Streptomyces sp. NPDC056930 TaxID=3345967 RepID=UPI003641011F
MKSGRPQTRADQPHGPRCEDGGRSALLGFVRTTAARIRACDRRAPWVWDLLVVAAFLLTGLPDMLAGPFQPQFLHIEAVDLSEATRLAMQIPLIVPLWWRRRAPLVVTAVIVSVSFGQWMQGVWLAGGIVIVPALFNVGLHTRPRNSFWAWAATTAALVTAGFRFGIGVAGVASLVGMVTAAVLSGLALRGSLQHITALEARAEQLERERRRSAEAAIAEERARMARELHDIVGHNLAVIVSLADGAAHLATSDPDRTAQASRMIADSSRQALTELRRLVGVMRGPDNDNAGPELTPQPSIQNLPALADRVRATGTPIELDLPEDSGVLSPGLQLAAYRIVQEAVTNALKYAAPGTPVTVAVRHVSGSVDIKVSDTGPRRGQDKATPTAGGGHGLIGMRERAALFDGEIAAGPDRDGGWTLHATLHDAPQPPDHERESS